MYYLHSKYYIRFGISGAFFLIVCQYSLVYSSSHCQLLSICIEKRSNFSIEMNYSTQFLFDKSIFCEWSKEISCYSVHLIITQMIDVLPSQAYLTCQCLCTLVIKSLFESYRCSDNFLILKIQLTWNWSKFVVFCPLSMYSQCTARSL